MGVAAQAMAWQQRLRNRMGPPATVTGTTGAVGEQPSGIPQVELYIGGWIDVTALGLVRYQQGIHITRGQPDENQKTNPATARFRLANLDGRFTPTNPLGPYYGQFDRNTPCRISVQSGNAKSYRFWGEVSSWPPGWDPTGNDAWVDVEAAGILRRLGTGNNPLKSAPYFYWVPNTPSVAGVAYWPMEDGSGSTQFASALGGLPMAISGSPSLANSSAVTPSNPLPSFGSGSSASATIPAYTPGQGTSSLSGLTCYLVIASGGETSQTLISLASTGTYPTWELYYLSTSGGQLGFRGRDASGNIVLDSGGQGTNLNGLPLIVGVDTYQGGGNVSFDFQIQAVAYNGLSVFYQQQTAAASAGRFTSIKLSPTASLTGTAIGHVAISAQAGYVPTSAYQGNPGEAAAARFQRLCNLANVSSHIVFSSATSDIGPAMGPQHPGKLLDLLQECVDADGGILFELTDRVGLGYRTRDTLENQAPLLALDYPSAQLADVPKPVVDDTYTRNDITATRLGGTFAVATQTVGPLNTQAPPAGVGDYQTSITVNVATDAQIADQAGWRLHLGTVQEPRYPVIGAQLAAPEITASTTLRQQILGVSPGDRVVITNPPAAWLPPDPISELVIGYTETFDQFLHHIQWNTRPESPFRVAVTDDPVFGHADTDGSTLAQPIGAPLTGNAFFTGGNLTGWTGFQGSIAATQAIPGGPFAWSCLYTSNGTAGGALEGSPAPFAVSAGTVAQTSCWVYSPTGGNVAVGVDWQDVNHNYLSTSVTTVAVPAGVWTAVGSGALTAPASTAFAYPRCGPTPAVNGLQLYVQGLLSWLGAVQVATTNSGSPLWTTSTADYPFDVSVGGERMTVTGVTGSSSPQAFTVTRAANTVVKPQSQGASVQLWQPAILSM